MRATGEELVPDIAQVEFLTWGLVYDSIGLKTSAMFLCVLVLDVVDEAMITDPLFCWWLLFHETTE